MSNEIEQAAALSPSLTARAEGATAYEVKFQIDETHVSELEGWAMRHLEPDPHNDEGQGGGYQITSLYTDTANLDVYHRTPKYRRRKYRLRRYGSESLIHLERKTRRGEKVAKKRVTVSEADLLMLSHGLALADWPGHWFHQSLLRKSLFPTCQLVYHRTAFLGHCSEGPLRLTIDREIRGQMTSDWKVETTEQAIPLLPDHAILELKFQNAMPTTFKQLAADMQLNATGFSKYRRCLDAWQVANAIVEPEVKYA